MSIKHRSYCPIAFALDIFGDKWSLLILRDVLFKGKRHYQEFLESKEGISTNILANRLEMLESAGLLRKDEDPENGRRYVYSPTEKTFNLLPAMLEIVRWSTKYYRQTITEFASELNYDNRKIEMTVRSRFKRTVECEK